MHTMIYYSITTYLLHNTITYIIIITEHCISLGLIWRKITCAKYDRVRKWYTSSLHLIFHFTLFIRSFCEATMLIGTCEWYILTLQNILTNPSAYHFLYLISCIHPDELGNFQPLKQEKCRLLILDDELLTQYELRTCTYSHVYYTKL